MQLSNALFRINLYILISFEEYWACGTSTKLIFVGRIASCASCAFGFKFSHELLSFVFLVVFFVASFVASFVAFFESNVKSLIDSCI